jgi:hypothetical protein
MAAPATAIACMIRPAGRDPEGTSRGVEMSSTMRDQLSESLGDRRCRRPRPSRHQIEPTARQGKRRGDEADHVMLMEAAVLSRFQANACPARGSRSTPVRVTKRVK